ncbi:MAG: 3-phosphoshikimate 1-carboxyvinyltransferase [Ilumatobacteraceae bacterium]
MGAKSFVPPNAALRGRVVVPGSKSESNRALVCAVLARGESFLQGVAGGDDTARMIAAARLLGASIEERDGTVRVRTSIDTSATSHVVLDAGLAGTTSRFLTAIAALRRGRTTVTGGPGLRARPMGELHRLVRALGATVSAEREGFLPVTVEGLDLASSARQGAEPVVLTARGDVSSQFISAIMMIAPIVGGLRIRLEGPVVSREYLHMTAAVMQSFGAQVLVRGDEVEVASSDYRATQFVVNPDWSSASYAFAAVAIAGGSVTVPSLRVDTAQPEAKFLEVLKLVGCTVRVSPGNEGVEVSRDSSQLLTGVDVDMSAMSDLVPTLAVIAACADSPTNIRGVGFIRSKESDRLGDLSAELSKCGVLAEVQPDGLRIEPRPLRSAVLVPHDDHRLAMSLALLGLVQSNISVEDPDVVGKSWPDFWSSMSTGFGLEILG